LNHYSFNCVVLFFSSVNIDTHVWSPFIIPLEIVLNVIRCVQAVMRTHCFVYDELRRK